LGGEEYQPLVKKENQQLKRLVADLALKYRKYKAYLMEKERG
jgi:hypothetical protein